MFFLKPVARAAIAQNDREPRGASRPTWAAAPIGVEGLETVWFPVSAIGPEARDREGFVDRPPGQALARKPKLDLKAPEGV